MEAIYWEILKEMDKRKIKQKDLAEKTNLSKARISQILSEVKQKELKDKGKGLKKILKALDLELEVNFKILKKGSDIL